MTAAGGAKPRFLALVGATASGKTELSEALAERLPIEVISMDSRQVYRGMDIGTDKISPEARARIPHHGLDLVPPSERYSAGRFGRDARGWIADIEARDRLPVLVGGTGFFLRALTDPIFEEPDLDPVRHADLRRYLGAQAPERLATWVRHLDPERAQVAVEGGPQRMGRTLEVPLLTGRALSWWHRAAPREHDPLRGVVVWLEVPRDELDRRIERRVDRMLERGFVDEVRGLVEAGYVEDDPGMSGTGYREVIAYLRGEVSLEESARMIRSATRRYARRQTTWFRHQLPADAVRIDATALLEERLARTLAIWKGRSAGGAPQAVSGGGDT